MEPDVPPPVGNTLDLLRVTVPGEPVAQGRGRAVNIPGVGIRVVDPAKSRNWKGTAQIHYLVALDVAVRRAPAFPAGVALDLHVVAVFTCPKSHHRKVPLPRRPKVGIPDAENIAKAVQDAGNGILWHDDSQVVRLTVEKWYGAQGEAPGVHLMVRALAEAAPARKAATSSDLFAAAERRA